MTVTGATRATKSGLPMDFVPPIREVPELRYSGSGIFYVRTHLTVSYRNDLKFRQIASFFRVFPLSNNEITGFGLTGSPGGFTF